MAAVRYGSVSSGISSERTSFLGPQIPSEVKLLGKLLVSIDKHTFRSIVKLIISDFEGRVVSAESYLALKNASKQPEHLDSIYSGLYTLLKVAYRIPEANFKQEVFKEDLQDLRIPNDFSPDLVSVVFGSRRNAVEQNSVQRGPQLLHLERFRWRVDVTISTSVLSRVLDPTILMEIECSDGKKRVFEVTSARFHQLRLAVSTLLQEMMQLEQRNTIRAV